MKKKTKLLMIIASALVLVGLALSLTAYAMVGFNPKAMQKKALTETVIDITDDITALKIDELFTDVKILPAADGDAHIVCREQRNVQHIVSTKGTTVTVEARDNRRLYESFLNLWDMELLIYLPVKIGMTVDISIAGGDVGIHGFDSAVFDKIKVKTASGDLKLTHTNATEIDLDTASGDVEIANVEARNFKATTASGDVEADGLIAQSRLMIKTASGDVELDNADAFNKGISIETASGDVECNLLSPKTLSTHSVSGHIDTPRGGIGAPCEIKTTSGDIEVEFSGYDD